MIFKNIHNINELLKQAKEKYKLYVDMDGVLVNFNKGFEDLTGLHPKLYIEEYGRKELFDAIRQHNTFWIDLEWMPDGKKLWNFIKDYNPEILSTPGGDIELCKKQKKEWIHHEIGDIPIHFSFHKEKYASKNSILIDDMPKNTVPWEESGGIAILHTSADSTMNALNKLLIT